MADTHFSNLQGKKITFDETLGTNGVKQPLNPRQGDFYFDTRNNRMAVYNNGQWFYRSFTTTTSTSTTTTTTSTSTSSSTTTTTSSSTSTTTTSSSTTTSL